MDGTVSAATWSHWAILIGVGIHRPPSLESAERQPGDRSLRGAVADIISASEYLESQPHVKITKLTATEEVDNGGPIEPPENLPTRYKVCSVLQSVIEEGMAGRIKHVYIHFSGHGTRMERIGPLALALYNSYLPTTKLAKDIDQMVKGGMFVTLVLDCCFSGSVKRAEEWDDLGARYIEYDPALDEECGVQQTLAEADAQGLRDSRINRDRLLSPEGYTVITACSPSEFAHEIEFKSGIRRGALSFFLDRSLRALKAAGTRITHQTLYHHLLARFHAEHPQQTPMRYGSTNICFFQGLTSGSGLPFISVFRTRSQGGDLVLGAGEAHGVHENDEYDAYPYYASENSDETMIQLSILLKVVSVESLTSKLSVIDSTRSTRIMEVTTWKARLRSSFSPRKTQVRFMPSLSEYEAQVLRQSQAQGFLQILTGEISAAQCDFMVGADADNKCYNIKDGASSAIAKLPHQLSIARTGDMALPRLRNMLLHLAAFKFFERIENRQPDPQFGNGFSIHVNSTLGQNGWYEVPHGGTWRLSLRNRRNTPIYLVIFNFRMSWQVANMVWEETEGDFLEIPAAIHLDSICDINLAMDVPDYVREAGLRQCEDVIKIFITSKPTPFPHMILPRLEDGTMRSSLDQLSDFLESFGKAFSNTRSDPDQSSWTTQNFLIRTRLLPEA